MIKLLALLSLLTLALTSSILSVAAPVTSADSFREVGKTSYGTVSIDMSSINALIDDDDAIASLIVKVKFNRPMKGVSTVLNATVFSCKVQAATVVMSTTLNAKNEHIQTVEKTTVIPWVKGADTAVNVIMEKLCKAPPKKSSEKGA